MSNTIYELFLEYFELYIFGTTGIVGEFSILLAFTSTLLSLVLLFRFMIFLFKFAYLGLFRYD